MWWRFAHLVHCTRSQQTLLAVSELDERRGGGGLLAAWQHQVGHHGAAHGFGPAINHLLQLRRVLWPVSRVISQQRCHGESRVLVAVASVLIHGIQSA